MTTGATHHMKSPLKNIKERQLGVPFWTIWDQKNSSEGTHGPCLEGPGSSMGSLGSPRVPKDVPEVSRAIQKGP